MELQEKKAHQVNLVGQAQQEKEGQLDEQDLQDNEAKLHNEHQMVGKGREVSKVELVALVPLDQLELMKDQEK